MELQETGRHFYTLQRQVREGRRLGRNWRKETVLKELRNGRTRLKGTFNKNVKNADGICAAEERANIIYIHILFRSFT